MTSPLTEIRRQLDDATTRLYAEREALLNRIKAAHARLRLATSGTLPPDELRAAFGAWLDRHFAEVRKRAGDIERSLSAKTPHVRADATDAAIALLLEPAIRAGVGAYITSLGAYTSAPRAPERAAMIEAIRAEIAELEAEDERFVDACQRDGIAIEHRPDVLRTREEAAHRQRVADERVAMQQEQIDALNARIAESRAGRAQPSQYITAAGRKAL